MRILEYSGLDTTGVAAHYRKVTQAIAREDFRAADVKKLANLGHGKFYRAKLDGADRLLFALVRHGGTSSTPRSRSGCARPQARSRGARSSRR